MKTQVKVWLTNAESSTTQHEVHGQLVVCHIPARTELVGITDADPEAILALLDLDESHAAAVQQALACPGSEVYLYEDYCGDVSVDVYLIIEEHKTLAI